MGDPQPTCHDLEKKRARNRRSQQTFRRRQALKFKELQDRIQSNDEPHHVANSKLQKENHVLREQLLQVQTKLSRLVEIIKRLSAEIETATDIPSSTTTTTTTSECPEPSSLLSSHKLLERSACHESDGDNMTVNDMYLFPEGIVLHEQPPETICISALNTTTDTHVSEVQGQAIEFDPVPDIQNYELSLNSVIPNTQSYEYHMGTRQYSTSLDMSKSNTLLAQKSWVETNSPFSDHIQTLQHCLLRKLGNNMLPPTPSTLQRISNSVLSVLSLFNSVTRPDAMSWYAKTRFYYIADLTTWQLCPCPKTFEKVHPLYRPTVRQLSVQYPSVIDWVPFPSIRDRMIRLHAANPHIDRIFCDAVSAYVVEACVSDIVTDAAPCKVYIRVNDLLNAGCWDQAGDESETWTAALPTTKVNNLFTSPACARAAFQYLGMNNGASRYKMDPAFFGQYPELYEPSTPDILAEGIPLRPAVQPILTYPQPLDMATYRIYLSFIEFTVSAGNGSYTRTDGSTVCNSNYAD